MAELVTQPMILAGEGWADYGLIDSGHGRKLERYGDWSFIRPEPQAMWTPRLASWDAHGEFVPGSDEDGGGRWQFAKPVPREGWTLAWNEVTFTAQCTPFRHLGFFPDMAPVWEWMREMLSQRPRGPDSGPEEVVRHRPSQAPSAVPAQVRDDGLSTLNLFGYTGVGTLALSAYGPVTHVDASKKSVAQARGNAVLSDLQDRPIRWLVDDAAKFTAREVRRSKRYDGIILDPPKFGRGPGGETWRLEEGLPGLLGDCRRLLDAESRFLFLTVYAVRMSSLALAGLMEELFADLPGTIEHGDLAVREDPLRSFDGLRAQDERNARLLPTAIFARWSNPG